MTEELTIREGTTAAIQMSLLADGAPINISGYASIEFCMLDNKKKSYRYSSNASSYVAVVSAVSGIVSFTAPGETTFLQERQPYHVYWWISSVSGTKFSVPESNTAVIKVLKDF